MGSEDKDGYMNQIDYDDPIDNVDQMAPFSNFLEWSRGPIGAEMLELMSSYYVSLSLPYSSFCFAFTATWHGDIGRWC